MKYAFIERHEPQHSVRRMCKVMQVHPSGYYAWKARPQSAKAEDDQRLTGLLKQAWLESGGVYGYRKLTLDMRDLGETCGKHRVARLLKLEGCSPRRITVDGLGVVLASLPWSPQSSAATLHCQRAQPVLGHGHHLHPYLRGLVRSSSRRGSLQKATQKR